MAALIPDDKLALSDNLMFLLLANQNVTICYILTWAPIYKAILISPILFVFQFMIYTSWMLQAPNRFEFLGDSVPLKAQTLGPTRCTEGPGKTEATEECELLCLRLLSFDHF